MKIIHHLQQARSKTTMPAVNPPKVLVSGASGFIAVWIVRTLLEHGFAVRGTVRSHKKGNYLKKMFESYGDRFEFVIVEDISSVSRTYLLMVIH
jgi:nucleoside-diphosphate-sugar epimerase